jgi:hypothetical protein
LFSIGLFILLGALGLGLDFLGVYLWLDKFTSNNEEKILFLVYIISVLFFTFLAYKLAFKFTKKSDKNNNSKKNESLAIRKKAYHISRFIFQLKILIISLIIFFILSFIFNEFLFSFFSILNSSEPNNWINTLVFGVISLNIIKIIILYFIACLLDIYLKEAVLGGYFFLVYLSVPIVLTGMIMYLDIKLAFIVSIFLSVIYFIISAFVFEYLRFKRIKSHPEIFRK